MLNEAALEPQVRGIVEALLPLTLPLTLLLTLPPLLTTPYYPLLPITTPYYPFLYPLLYPSLYYVPRTAGDGSAPHLRGEDQPVHRRASRLGLGLGVGSGEG